MHEAPPLKEAKSQVIPRVLLVHQVTQFRNRSRDYFAHITWGVKGVKRTTLSSRILSSSAEMSTNNVIVWSGSTLFASITSLTNDVIPLQD